MSPLERRCRLLMRAYPAAYRRERADEILATLLEATPEGRRRPLLRDMRALVVGGLRARAAQNRRYPASVNLRLAVLAGICIYLGAVAAGDLDTYLYSELEHGVPMVGRLGWPALLAGLLIGAVVVLTWLAPRVGVLAAAVPAAAAAGYAGVSAGELAFVVTQLACLAAVAALTVRGLERRSPAWLWLVGAVVVTQLLPGYLQYIPGLWFPWLYMAPGTELGLLVVAIAWVAVDARLLVAIAAYFVLMSLPPMLENLAWGVGDWFANPYLAVAAAIGAVAVWRLRRQSLRPGQVVH
jgi:hypothetical protein